MRLLTLIALALLGSFASRELRAQPPMRGAGGDAGQRRPMRGGDQPANQAAGQNQAVGANMQQQNRGNQNRPSAEQLATMMIQNFDSDASGALEPAELVSALTALMQHMAQMQARQGQMSGAAGVTMRGANLQEGSSTRQAGPTRRGATTAQAGQQRRGGPTGGQRGGGQRGGR